jgi:hypothetical protein
MKGKQSELQPVIHCSDILHEMAQGMYGMARRMFSAGC